MTSRERLQTAIERGVSDRVPYDLGSSITEITRAALFSLSDYLSLKVDLQVIVKPLQLAEVPQKILVLLGNRYQIYSAVFSEAQWFGVGIRGWVGYTKKAEFEWILLCHG